MFPVIHLSACEELAAVVDYLVTLDTASLRDMMTPEFRADLDTLKRTCPLDKRSGTTAEHLAIVEERLKS